MLGDFVKYTICFDFWYVNSYHPYMQCTLLQFSTVKLLSFSTEFCPYHIGQFTIGALQLQEKVKVQHFEGLLVTLCGYCVVGIVLVVLHAIASICRSKK